MYYKKIHYLTLTLYMIEVYKIMMKGLHLNYSILLIKAQARTRGHSLKVTNHFFDVWSFLESDQS